MSPNLRAVLNEIKTTAKDELHRRVDAIERALDCIIKCPAPSTPAEWVAYYNARLTLVMESENPTVRALAPTVLESCFAEALKQKC